MIVVRHTLAMLLAGAHQRPEAAHGPWQQKVSLLSASVELIVGPYCTWSEEVVTVVEREGKSGLPVVQASHMNMLLGINAFPPSFGGFFRLLSTVMLIP